MKTIIDTLNEFTDTELAYLHQFQLNTYMIATQTKIKKYIFKTRKLNQWNLDDLIAKNANCTPNDNKYRCIRCKSAKLHFEIVDGTPNGKTQCEKKITCNVCGFLVADPENENKTSVGEVAVFVLELLSEL
jgi:hypothetical protein